MSDTATKTRPSIDEGAKAPSLTRLIKLMGMTTSMNDNEALAFLRRANEEAAKFGTWAEILTSKITVIGDPFASPTFVLPEAKAPQTQPVHKQPVRPSPPPPPPKPKPPRYWDLDEVLYFGKHGGKTIREIILNDRSYIAWARRNIADFFLTSSAEAFYMNPVVPTFDLGDIIHIGPYAGGSVWEIIHHDPAWLQRATVKLSADAQDKLRDELQRRIDAERQKQYGAGASFKPKKRSTMPPGIDDL